MKILLFILKTAILILAVTLTPNMIIEETLIWLLTIIIYSVVIFIEIKQDKTL